jgi:hypothetical protein
VSTTGWIIIAIVVILLIVLALAYAAWQRRRTAALQQRYGPEYDHTVQQTGKRRRAESELRAREKEHDKLQLQPLPPESLQRYRSEWSDIQQEFVDDPRLAVERADQVAGQILNERGYPTDNFDVGAAQVSVDHPDIVQRYRTAHGIAESIRDGEPTTEELRRAVTSYRSLVDVLLEDGQQQSAG